MSALLSTPLTFQLQTSDPNTVLATCPYIELGADKRLSLQCAIDNGAATPAAPTDNPQGSFQLYFSADPINAPFIRNLLAESGVANITGIAPNGNNLVSAQANFTDCPARYCKVLYVVSNSAPLSRCRLWVTAGTN